MRRPRLDLPGIPQHLTHRGVNRAATFIDDDDYNLYLQTLAACASHHNVQLHAYVLMTNHVHLLVTSPAAGAVSRTMQALGRRYVRAFNTKYERTGTLWDGRYRSCLIDSDRYLIACLRYIELNPVRAAMVERAEDYCWSSARHHLDLGGDHLIASHAGYIALGRDNASRAAAYRALLDQAVADEELVAIRHHMRQERALGSPRFQAMVEKTLSRPVRIRAPGRPRKAIIDPGNSNANVL